MSRNAFTLIELLAVIVILAIIALIAVPIVLSIINDSKVSSEEEGLKLYQDAVQKEIAHKQLEESGFNPDRCKIQNNGNLECFNGEESLGIVKIEMKGSTPTKGLLTIQDNKFNYTNLYLNNKYYYEKGILVEKNGEEEINIGDKYTYKVNDTDTFNFYVLSLNSDNTVNLIMDRNICNDGTVEYTSGNNYCRYKWYSAAGNNTYGPVTAMQELYAGTKDWNNVPDMIMNYEDENNNSSEEMGYTSIITSNGITTITGKPTSNTITIGTASQPLKARLPKYNEVKTAGCDKYVGACPIWLIENMSYTNVSNDKYSINNNSEAYQNQIYGYWLLSSFSGFSNFACTVRNDGYALLAGGTSELINGIRPVITVPKFDLSN